MDPFNLIKNLPFALESNFYRRFNSRLKRHPSSQPFISGDTFRGIAQHHLDDFSNNIDITHLKTNDIVFVSSWRLHEFIDKYLPIIRTTFYLITHQGDVNIQQQFMILIENPFLLKWFAQNALIKHPKIHPIPIGLEDQRRHENGLVSDFKYLGNRKRKYKKAKIVRAFSINTNPLERFHCYLALHKFKTVIDFWQPLNARRYRKELVKYMMVASPPGNGHDCHRTWEAMYLGVVPILKRSLLSEYYLDCGLPVILVDDWNEIREWSEELIIKKYKEISPRFKSEKLWFEYWKNKITHRDSD